MRIVFVQAAVAAGIVIDRTLIRSRSAVAADTPPLELSEEPVEISFQYWPAWGDGTEVFMACFPNGRTTGAVLTSRWSTSDPSRFEWMRQSEFEVPRDDFDRIQRMFDSPELERSAKGDWSALPDGSRWILRRTVGAYSLVVEANSPELKHEGAAIVHLAHSITTIANVRILPEEKQ